MSDDLIDRLRNGVVEHAKRWSGDTHDDLGGSADYAATDAIMTEAAAALTEAQATIARLEAERAWRPVAEDPPPYETRVLTWWPGTSMRRPRISIDQRNSGSMLGKRDVWWSAKPSEQPTHWQTLPDEPKIPHTDTP